MFFYEENHKTGKIPLIAPIRALEKVRWTNPDIKKRSSEDCCPRQRKWMLPIGWKDFWLSEFSWGMGASGLKRIEKRQARHCSVLGDET